MSAYPRFPLFIDLSGKRITVVGGGNIAARRVKTLLEFTQTVTVIAPELSEALRAEADSGRVEWIARPYETGDLNGAFLALAATDNSAVNERVCADARAAGIPVNIASDRKLCDFWFPGIARSGELIAGVNAGGSDHRAARRAAERIRELLDQMTNGTEENK